MGQGWVFEQIDRWTPAHQEYTLCELIRMIYDGCHSQIFCLKFKSDVGKYTIGLIQCAESFVGREIQFLLLNWMMTFLTSIGFSLCIFMIGIYSRGGWTVTIKHDCVFATNSHWFGTETIERQLKFRNYLLYPIQLYIFSEM